MTKHLISFDDGAMAISDEELPEVAKAAYAVVVRPSTPKCGYSAAE